MSLWSRTGTVGLLFLIALLVSSTAGLAAPVESNDVRDPSPDTGFETTVGTLASNHTTPVEVNTTLTVDLQSNGNARWIITKRFNVTTDNQTEAFEELAEQFEEGETAGSGLGLSAFQRAIELVDAETDRSMQMREINRSASSGSDLIDRVGELTISFTWENFARFESEKLVIDDVLETEHGIWLSGLADNQKLVVNAPEGYGIDDANTVPQNSSLHWEGPTTFDNTTLQATFIGVSGTDSTATPGTPTQGVSTPKDPSETSGLALGVGLLAAIVVIVLLATNRERIEAIVIEEPDDEADEAESEPGAEVTEVEEEDEADESEVDDDIDVELLSDEERVERLLEENGGRMKQANIVKETDWSNAKVSQLLSSMEEQGRIDKLRIGRENLISFPEEDVADITDDE
jgi:uncharacterized membrane protein